MKSWVAIRCVQLILLALGVMPAMPAVPAIPEDMAGSVGQDLLRIGVVTPAGEGGDLVEAELRRSIDREERLPVELIDRELMRLARLGTGYDGNLNLSLDEARGLGQAFGSDYFVLGRVFPITRPVEGPTRSFATLVALYLVESRTGRLRSFQQATVAGRDAAEAERQVPAVIAEIWEVFVATIRAIPPAALPVRAVAEPPPPEIFTDEGDWTGRGLQPPVFLRQLKPAYPPTAARVEIEATVELVAVFRADGQVDQVELRRWAGFGLDESAVATVRQLRFQAATRNGQPVSFRGLVRYNFRRPAPQAIRSATKSQEERDRLKRSINDLLKIRPIP